MSQKVTKWKPSTKQATMLKIVKNTEINQSITAICKAAHVTRQTYYRWMKKEEFRKAWVESWEENIKDHFPQVVNAQIQKAVKGDTQAARLIAELKKEIRTMGGYSEDADGGSIQIIMRYPKNDRD